MGLAVPTAPLLLGGPPGWVAYAAINVLGAIVTGLAAYGIYQAVSNADSKADDSTKSTTDATTACANCDKKDPCKGLRDQLAAHRAKLAQYMKDPASMDNLGLLGKGNDSVIIAGRIASLQKQIAMFEREVKKCEEANANS